VTATLTWGTATVPVPYVAAWTEETTDIDALVAYGDRLGYRDEIPEDRDP
jgi:hypothetical protein